MEYVLLSISLHLVKEELLRPAGDALTAIAVIFPEQSVPSY